MSISTASLEYGINFCDRRLTTLQERGQWDKNDRETFHNTLDALSKMKKKIPEGNALIRDKHGIAEARIKFLFSQLIASLEVHAKKIARLTYYFSLKNDNALNAELGQILLLCDVIRPNLSYANEEIQSQYANITKKVQHTYEQARLLKEGHALYKDAFHARNQNVYWARNDIAVKQAHRQELNSLQERHLQYSSKGSSFILDFLIEQELQIIQNKIDRENLYRNRLAPLPLVASSGGSAGVSSDDLEIPLSSNVSLVSAHDESINA